MKNILVLFLITIALFACKKEAGSGGNATIEGSVSVRDYNATFTQLIGTYPAKDTYVYIVYGDHPGYDKRIKTDYKGEYSFPFLYPGDYTVYTYSLDSTLQDLSGRIAVVKKVTIEKKQKEVSVDPFIIFE